MIFNDTIFTENGDEIIFQTVPLYGLDSISSYSDSTSNENNLSSLKRTFCFSFDGVVFTDYFDLTNDNLASQINSILTNITSIIIRFSYKLVSVEDSPQIELLSLVLNATYSKKAINFPISSKSVYKDLVYDEINVHNLMVNLSEKLYERGILPQYIIRNEEGTDIFADKDYIEFWSTVAKFYALFLIDAYKFTNIYFRYFLLSEFLKQKGIFFNNKNTLIDLQLIAQNFYDETRQRGGFDIFRAKGYEYFYGSRNVYQIPVDYNILPSSPVIIDGVFYKEIDELPFGWTVQNNLYVTNGLVAPDTNYHRVIFGTEDVNSVISPGDFNDDYNDDFFVGEVTQITASILPATKDSEVFKRYDGEYLRLIGYRIEDEIIFNQVDIRYLGWFANTSSPLYKGLRAQYNEEIIKSYESSKDFFDLENFPILTQILPGTGGFPYIIPLTLS